MTRTAWVSHFANLQKSGLMKTFTDPFEYPAHYRAKITVEAEDVVSACRSACRCVAYDRRVEEPRYGASPLMSALVAEGAEVDPWRFVPDGGDASVLPVPGVFSEVAACAGYAATRSEDLVDQLHIMIDAIGADGALRITPAAMVRLCATGQALLDDIATFGLSPTSTVAASMVTSAPDAT